MPAYQADSSKEQQTKQIDLMEQLKEKELRKCQMLLSELLLQLDIHSLSTLTTRIKEKHTNILSNGSFSSAIFTLNSSFYSRFSSFFSSFKSSNFTNSDKNRPHKCDHCHRSFRFKSNLFEHKSLHMNVFHRNTFVCPFCEKTCRLKGNLKKHLQIHVTTVDDLERLWKSYFSRQSGRPRKNTPQVPLPKPGDDLGLVPVFEKTVPQMKNNILQSQCQWKFADG